MKRTGILSRFLPLDAAASVVTPVRAGAGMEWTMTADSEAFCAETFPHMDAVYADAFCLTGSPDAAADLVEAAYVRAFSRYEQFRRRRFPIDRCARGTLDWLYFNLHSTFCDSILAHAAPQEALIGDHS